MLLRILLSESGEAQLPVVDAICAYGSRQSPGFPIELTEGSPGEGGGVPRSERAPRPSELRGLREGGGVFHGEPQEATKGGLRGQEVPVAGDEGLQGQAENLASVPGRRQVDQVQGPPGRAGGQGQGLSQQGGQGDGGLPDPELQVPRRVDPPEGRPRRRRVCSPTCRSRGNASRLASSSWPWYRAKAEAPSPAVRTDVAPAWRLWDTASTMRRHAGWWGSSAFQRPT